MNYRTYNRRCISSVFLKTILLWCWQTTCITNNVSHAFSIAPELQREHIDSVSTLVSNAMGDTTTTTKVIDETNALGSNSNRSNDDNNNGVDLSRKILDRYTSVRTLSNEMLRKNDVPENQLVYGELSIPVLATILDAVELRPNENFLDIGSGDGALVLGAKLLYDNTGYMKKAIGIELIPGLVERSIKHKENLLDILDNSATRGDETEESYKKYNINDFSSSVKFVCGDVNTAQNDSTLSSILSDTTIAVCFATSWCTGNAVATHSVHDDGDDSTKEDGSNNGKKGSSLQRRKLPELSKALTLLPFGARIVMIDARLDEKDGYIWKGDLILNCPDTAPYSVGSLYERI